jgi:intein/homing endonuclease
MVLTSNGYRKVLKTFDNGIKEVSEYCINGIILRCTDSHRLKTTNGWKRIDELEVGDVIYVHNGGESIVDVTRSPVLSERVYDLHVEGVHEYFANGVLVHNCIDAIRYIVIFLAKEGIIKNI